MTVALQGEKQQRNKNKQLFPFTSSLFSALTVARLSCVLKDLAWESWNQVIKRYSMAFNCLVIMLSTYLHKASETFTESSKLRNWCSHS